MTRRRPSRASFGRVFLKAASAWWNDNAMRLGASLSFYTVFAIAPVLLVAIAIAGLAFGPEAVRGELVGQMDGLVGREGALAIQALLEGASKRQASVLATLVGTVSFMFTATTAFLELQAALNAIWRVAPNPDANWTAFLRDRVRSFGLVVGIGFLLLVSLVISAVISAASAWVGRQTPGWPIVAQGLNTTVSFLVTATLFAMLFKFLPDVKLEWRHVATGAIVTAVLFTVGKHLIGLYLARSATASSYGAAASVMLLLLWVYYSSQILLFGAEFTRIYAASMGERPKPEEFAERDPKAAVKAT